jgi:hypothetical protein
MTMQPGGSMVVKGNNCAIWSSQSTGNGDYLSMRGDGNPAFYGPVSQASPRAEF